MEPNKQIAELKADGFAWHSLEDVRRLIADLPDACPSPQQEAVIEAAKAWHRFTKFEGFQEGSPSFNLIAAVDALTRQPKPSERLREWWRFKQGGPEESRTLTAIIAAVEKLEEAQGL